MSSHTIRRPTTESLIENLSAYRPSDPSGVSANLKLLPPPNPRAPVRPSCFEIQVTIPTLTNVTTHSDTHPCRVIQDYNMTDIPLSSLVVNQLYPSAISWQSEGKGCNQGSYVPNENATDCFYPNEEKDTHLLNDDWKSANLPGETMLLFEQANYLISRMDPDRDPKLPFVRLEWTDQSNNVNLIFSYQPSTCSRPSKEVDVSGGGPLTNGLRDLDTVVASGYYNSVGTRFAQ